MRQWVQPTGFPLQDLPGFFSHFLFDPRSVVDPDPPGSAVLDPDPSVLGMRIRIQERGMEIGQNLQI